MPTGASRAAHEGAQGSVPRDVSPASPRNVAAVDISFIERIGSGAITEVWLAAISDGTRVAVKRLAPKWAGHPAAARLLRDEVKWLAEASHPSIIRQLGWIDAESSSAPDESAFAGPAIVLEYLDGGDFVSLAGAAPEHWLAAACAIADALEYLHRRRIVHGDIKATNVLFDRSERPRLIDFSCARRAGEVTSYAIGTKSQQRSRSTGHIVSTDDDSFAFAALLFELLEGRPPFVDPAGRRASHGPADLKSSSPQRSSAYPELADAVLDVLLSSDVDGDRHLQRCKRALLETSARLGVETRDYE